MMNSINLIGNLTRDVEMRSTGKVSVANISVAINEKRKNTQTGEYEDRPVFVDCALFGNRAEALEHVLVKGTRVGIQGHLTFSKWKTDSGETRTKLAVIVEDIDIMTARAA